MRRATGNQINRPHERNLIVKRIFKGVVVGFLLWESLSASAQTGHEQYMDICRDYTNSLAKALTLNRDIAAKKKVISNSSGNLRSQAKAGNEMDQVFAGVGDYMIQSLTAAPKLTERELATLGFAYCVQRKPF